MILQDFEPINVAVIDMASELGVVLRYDPDTMESPIVVEKIDGPEVQTLTERGLLTVESSLLAQVLLDRCDRGESVPKDLYPDVGKMLGSAYVLHTIAANLKDALIEELASLGSSYTQNPKRHPECPTLARSSLRVSLG